MLVPDTGHYTGLGWASAGQWQQSQQILFIRELRPSLGCRVSCSAAVSRTPSHAGAGVCVMSCLHAEKRGTLVNILCIISTSCSWLWLGTAAAEC